MDHPTVPPIPAGSRAEEAALLHTLRCACGAKLKFRNRRHRNLRDGCHYDWMTAVCPSCGTTREVLFDISGWFKLWILWMGAVAFGLLGLFALGAATVLPGMSGEDRRNGLIAAPFCLTLAGFCLWAVLSVGRLDYAVASAGGEDAAMAEALAELGIPLDFGVSDPAAALTGGAAKAGLWEGIRRMRTGDAAGARNAFEAVLKGLEGEADPRWEPVRGAARKLLDRG